jgi:hypothetical protein
LRSRKPCGLELNPNLPFLENTQVWNRKLGDW